MQALRHALKARLGASSLCTQAALKSSPLQHSTIVSSIKTPTTAVTSRFTSGVRFQSSKQKPKLHTSKSNFPIIPIIVIVAMGSGAFALLINQRKEQDQAKKAPVPAPAKPVQVEKDTPVFDPKEVTVLYVLGGPGAGKGTQCANLVRDFDFVHLSAGDLLRAEQERPGSQFGELIKTYIREGKIVPMEVTIALLQNAMAESLKNSKPSDHPPRFLIDGFPRQLDQAIKFEEAVCPSKFTIFFDCPEEVMEARLLNRGKTSGRSDDNIESIKKRFKTFVNTSMPVVDMFERQGKVLTVNAAEPVDTVYNTVKREVARLLKEKEGK